MRTISCIVALESADFKLFALVIDPCNQHVLDLILLFLLSAKQNTKVT